MAYGTVNADVIGTSVSGSNLGAGNASIMKNRIINGAMTIDQRNAGASVTPTTGQYTVDRWQARLSQASKFTVQQNAGSVTAPAGFNYYLGATSSSAYTVSSTDFFFLQQRIEGYNVADLNWGTANAKTVTLSFWVRSSLTGTFGGSLFNDNADRSYPFTYTISSANTWTQASVTIAGDTSGTWLTTNGNGLSVNFSLGSGTSVSGTAGSWAGATYYSATGATSVVGTNGATFYITGVQLEVGSSATGYEYRQYGQELALCQRYYYKTKAGFQYGGMCPIGRAQTGSQTVNGLFFPIPMRIAPTSVETTGTGTDYVIANLAVLTVCNAVPTIAGSTTTTIGYVNAYVSSGLTGGQSVDLITNSANAYLGWSAEL